MPDVEMLKLTEAMLWVVAIASIVGLRACATARFKARPDGDRLLAGLTSFHRMPSFELTNALGKIVTEADLDGKVYVAHFMPRWPVDGDPILRSLEAVRRTFYDNSDVQFVSYAATSEHDGYEPDVSPWRAVEHDGWALLTGDQEQIALIECAAYFAGDAREISGPEAARSRGILLVDDHGYIRRVYDGQAPSTVRRLIEDIACLEAERSARCSLDDAATATSLRLLRPHGEAHPSHRAYPFDPSLRA